MLSPYRGRGFYDPLSEMNRLFAQVFGLTRNQGGSNQPQQADQSGQATQEITAWAPAIDVIQRDDDLVVRAELPGVTPDEVDITIQNNVLTISGRISEEREEEREGYLVRERRTGMFRRSLQLPQEVDEDDVSARFEDGVLEVVIKGAAEGQEPKHVQVESSDGGGSKSQRGGGQRRPAALEKPGAESSNREGSLGASREFRPRPPLGSALPSSPSPRWRRPERRFPRTP